MGKLARPFALYLALLIIGGCSAIGQQIVASARQPGEQLATPPDQLLKELRCDERQRPFVQVESMQVLPEMIKPGGRVNIRLIYAMCPLDSSEVIKTQVMRRMLYKGEQVATNTKEGFELKPGRWIVDSFFTLPRESPLGVYALEVAFQIPSKPVQKQVRSFVVSNEFYLSGE
jgi:hypothetical protein